MKIAEGDYYNFYEKVKAMNEKDATEVFLVYNLSPIIVKIKPASTITFKKDSNIYVDWIRYGKSFLNDLGLKILTLKENNKISVSLIYNEDLLKEAIGGNNEKKFLINIGYDDELKLNSILKTLRERCINLTCPHELGLFLGIPLNDVIDFIESKKKCVFNGYWKVYSNVDRSIQIFNEYDRVKSIVIDLI